MSLLFLWTAAFAVQAPARLPHATPESVGMSSGRLRWIDDLVEEGLRRRQMPGAVVLVARDGRIVWLKAYGKRRLLPSEEPMTTDTVFDMASITKPTATATSIMILIQQGKLGLDDPIVKHIPEFAPNGKDTITVRHLLTHQGGFIPDNPLEDYEDGPERALERIWALAPQQPPGTKFVYSDVGFIVLGELVRRLGGMNVDEFSQRHVFGPLGMTETGYRPREELRARAAPTEQRDGAWIRGEVHDPRAHKLGGVAGHAGLFSSAEDLALYAQMMLDGGGPVLKPETVALMKTPQPVSDGLRALGWDMRTSYSSNRGDLFSPRAFGHGGFTGTAMWIDPELRLVVIFLSNRVHPDGKGAVNPLAGRIGTVAAAAILEEPARAGAALTGIDVLVRDGFDRLRGRRVGLITNHTGVNGKGVPDAKLLQQAPGVTLVRLFSPEHGFEGRLDVSKIGHARDPATGLEIFSLYGETRRPTPESLEGIDTLVFDIQDIGARFYTYVSTMGYAMQAAAERKLRFVVLDRPNPIGGLDVEGPVLDAGRESFTAFHRIPVRHGMTVGELAGLFNAELKLGLDLQVVRAEGWRRRDFYDATGLTWINPSPNMRSLNAALLYPGIGLLETTNLSVGRGTDTPFELIGAPWIDGAELARELNRAAPGGLRFVPVAFTPTASVFKGERCGGVNILIAHRHLVRPVRAGLTIALALRRLYPQAWKSEGFIRLLGHERTFRAVLDGRPLDEIEAAFAPEREEFLKRRAPFLLYPE
jgi:uncharacterized protein YbbC (DUF1343 family)